MLTGAVNRSKRELSREARAATITREPRCQRRKTGSITILFEEGAGRR